MKVDNTKSRCEPITSTVNIEGIDLDMEVDTGSGKSLISCKTFQSNFLDIPLRQSNVRLKTLTGEELKVYGQIQVKVEANKEVKTLPLCRVGNEDEDCPSLLGRDWLRKIRLDWNDILNR